MIRIDRLVARAAALALALSVAAPASHAQGGGGGAQDSQRRARLEQQVRERLAGMVQERLRLTEAQMTRLKQTNARFEPQRRQLFQQERQVRLALRQEAARDSLANQQHVSTLITQAIAIQRQRLDLVDAEQKELAQFLTPLQRARYLDLQEKLRQRVEQLRHGQGGGGGRRGGMGPRGSVRP
jgi:Spy/CpxP family protein refolding chaperone